VSGQKPTAAIPTRHAGRENSQSFSASAADEGRRLTAQQGRRGQEKRPFVVAIDGPAGSGKGTLARRLAAGFGLAHLDTGALYRATALLLLHQTGDLANPAAAAAAARCIDLQLLADPRLRGNSVAAAASVVAAIPEVRQALLGLQREFAAHPPPPARGAVLDGRDIGTVVCPSADVKLFITAAPAVRAARRVQELREQGSAAIYENVLEDLNERDARDSGRRGAPLAVASDAEVIDTTALDADAVFERACRLVAQSLEEK
jgi:cytidylate kinase